MDRRRFLLGLLATGAGGSVACGYALAGHGTFLPSYIETVGIPQFINTTPYYEVENVFSQDVRTEFINRGKYKIVPEATGVDALLTGEILAIVIQPASFTDQAQASRYTIQVTAKIEFRDMHTNKVIWDNPQWLFRERVRGVGRRRRARPERLFRAGSQRARPRRHRIRQIDRQHDSRSVLNRTTDFGLRTSDRRG